MPRCDRGPVDADLSTMLAMLQSSNRDQLISIWTSRWSEPPPLALSASKLRRHIAYRVQLAWSHADGSKAGEDLPATGTPVLRRTWKGEDHEVLPGPSGFLHKGVQYRSLSAVARAITGTRWNGLVFFSADHLRSQPRRRST